VKKAFIVTFIVAILMFFNIDVFALDETCTNEEKMRLIQLVNATNVTYEFVEEMHHDYNEIVRYYKVIVSNFKPDFYIYDEQQGTFFEYNGNSIVEQGKFYGGINYKLPFIASSKSPCANNVIMTKYVRMLPYNEYSTDPLCVGHETYELCKKFTPIRITSRSDFEQRMKEYIRKLDNKDEPEIPVEEKEENTFFDKILDFLTDYYMYILVFIIITGITGIVIIEVRKRREIL